MRLCKWLLLIVCTFIGVPLFGQSIFKTNRVVIGSDDKGELRAILEGAKEAPKTTASTAKKPPTRSSSRKTPEQERTQLLQKLVINRSNSGILEERLRVKRLAEADPAPEGKDEDLDEKAALLKQYKQDVDRLRSDVVLGNWQAVQSYLETLPDKDASLIYKRILQQLGGPATVTPRPELIGAGATSHPQPQYIRPVEIWSLSDIAKKSPGDAEIELIAGLIQSLKPLPEDFLNPLEQGTRYFGKTDHDIRSRTAKLLLAAQLIDQAEQFLPDESEAREKDDYGALNLLARFHNEAPKTKKSSQHVATAWQLCTDIISETAAPLNERGKALYRALALVPELGEGEGKAWLTKTFTDSSGEGFEILSAVGTLTAQTREHRSSAFRLKQLELQSAAAKALLNNQEELADWQEILTLYVRNWNAEAKRSYAKDRSNSLRPNERRDAYGNRYYVPVTNAPTSVRDVPPIVSADLIKIRATDKWLQQIDPAVRLEHLSDASALLLKVKEDQAAFDLLKQLSKARPDRTKKLVRDMIQVWIENNNPNQNTRYRSRFSYYYGYSQVAESIPLTRSRQERNLVELSTLVKRVKELELDEDFEEEFADAFIQAHSKAEVWRVEALETVFGPIDNLSPDTIASLLTRMRVNLARLWPNPKLQQQAKTNRSEKEIKEQILKGYATAMGLCEKAANQHPDSWSLALQKASLLYEESNYRATLGDHPDHLSNKLAALEQFEQVTQRYVASLPLDDKKKETVGPFLTWFYGALGSPDLGALRGHHQPVVAAFPKIKNALESIPEAHREWHLTQFARSIDNRLANVGPDLKYRYLDSAIQIIGEHEDMEDAVKVFHYYRDLNTEIKLDVYVDGSDEINADQPFGLFVNLLHTREIQRESGGFNKYLVNQNNSRNSYNYGRPKEDYREKFEKSARSILAEHFEILSLTFHNPKVKVRSSEEEGWTITPYAYFLLKARGAEVDSIPPLKIDLDFLDTSGSVILPVASAAVPIDATATQSPRPIHDLQLTMTLDEREAEQNAQLALEVRATGKGLIPPLDELIELPLEGLEVVDTEDRKLQVDELDTESDEIAPVSSHEWRLVLEPSKKHLPETFKFPAIKTELLSEADDNLILQRYDDVDLVAVESAVPLAEGKASVNGWYLVMFSILAIGIFYGYLFLRNTPEVETDTAEGPPLPKRITPVTVLSYLENLYETKSLDSNKHEELGAEISELKANTFSQSNQEVDSSELRKVADKWRQLARS